MRTPVDSPFDCDFLTILRNANDLDPRLNHFYECLDQPNIPIYVPVDFLVLDVVNAFDGACGVDFSTSKCPFWRLLMVVRFSDIDH